MSEVTETSKAWMVNLKVNEIPVTFKVDTGAAVTALPSSMVNSMSDILPTSKSLRGAGNNKLSVQGQAKVHLRLRDKFISETVYFVDGLRTPLLGKPAISNLGLIQFIDAVESETALWWTRKYPKLFTGLGTLPSKVKIDLDPNVVPFVQSVPRRVAAARKQPLKEELDRMECLGVIRRVEEPTDWCAPCVVVPKKDGKIRVCIDFTNLNKAVKRQYHPLPTSEETLNALGGSRVFSKLDANCGYWQMELDKESYKLTTFITPFGRYFCQRLPFGISSAPEIFQREMQKILVDLPGVVCQMDDILVFGKDQHEHDYCLKRVLERLQQQGVTLNVEKCEFSKSEVRFLGHIVGNQGIKADPEKTRAIVNFPKPSNKKELRRFFGVVNYLGKFSAAVAENSVALRKLLSKDFEWYWGDQQEAEFRKLKQIMASTPTLSPFTLGAETILSADASSYGIGAAILQRFDNDWKPIAYASRSLTATEKRYAQIEKEALAICWACEKFNYYLAGNNFTVETDHKPLLAVLGTKELAKLPIRVQRFRLKMMAYSYNIVYTPGNKLVVADALSRSPVCDKTGDSNESNYESCLINVLVESLPVARNRLERIKASILEDETSLLLIKYVSEGWPRSKDVEAIVKPYYTFRDFFTVVDGVLYYNNRIFIPHLERQRVLDDVHAGHQGESKCIRRATEVVWWPGMSSEIRSIVKSCPQCTEHRRIPREPLLTTPLPERPWWRVALDLFEMNGKTYMVVFDYYSRYITVHELKDTSNAGVVVRILENLFCLLGIPNTIVSDNGPQFISSTFSEFTKKWDIIHVTSSPKYPQSNGAAERAVQTVKELMKKNLNVHAALCAYRDTALGNGYSPAQLLFGRSLNSMGILSTRSVDVKRLKDVEGLQRQKQEQMYNVRHRVQMRAPILHSQPVVVRDRPKSSDAVVLASQGREVITHDNGSILRRNRAHVSSRSEVSVSSSSAGVDAPNVSSPINRISPASNMESTSNKDPEISDQNNCLQPGLPDHRPSPMLTQAPVQKPSPRRTRTRYGRVSVPPKRLDL